MNSSLLVPVTPDLRKELAASAATLATIDKPSGSRDATAPNDKDHFPPMVNQLETLTSTVLEAAGFALLTEQRWTTARFDMGPKTEAGYRVGVSASYLRSTAAGASTMGELSIHQREHLNVAVSRLRDLHDALMAAIMQQTMLDLTTVRSKSLDDFLKIAETLANEATA